MHPRKNQRQKRLSAKELEYINSDSKDTAIADANEKVSWVKLLGYKQT